MEIHTTPDRTAIPIVYGDARDGIRSVPQGDALVHMFDAMDFLSELPRRSRSGFVRQFASRTAQHIQPKGTQLIRRYGLYAETLGVSAGSSAQRGTALIIGSGGDGKRWTTLLNVPRTADEPSTS